MTITVKYNEVTSRNDVTRDGELLGHYATGRGGFDAITLDGREIRCYETDNVYAILGIKPGETIMRGSKVVREGTICQCERVRRLAAAGQCSHGGHGWDGETCDDIPAGCDHEAA